MLEQHLHLRLIGCHLASIEWSVAELARWLERFPQAVVEMSARISQLQVQTIADREKVRQFMIRYQDRILYGTDTNLGSNGDPTRRTADLDRMWRDDWRYLVSDEWMESSKVNGKFQGLKLPRPVIDKIYRENALKVLPGVFKQ
jgi:predicted TIM-barrel fold metal-dependent hydrolase